MASHLTIPFLLPTTIRDNENIKTPVDLVDLACSRAQATCLVSWNLPFSSAGNVGTTGGIAMGCEDGSLFVFRSNTRAVPIVLSPTSPQMRALRTDRIPSTSSSRASSPLRRARSPSPSISGIAPFNVASRSRIVAGVTREQAQAPKNFVDFDEEPDKLKEMLRSGGGVRERTVMDGIIPSLHHDLAIGGKGEKDGKRPVLQAEVSTPGEDGSLVETKQRVSYIRSPPLSNVPLSPPRSPPVPTETHDSPSVTLQYHVIFSGSVNGSTIKAMEHLQDVNQLLILQSHGQLLVCDVEDGSCITNLRCPGNWAEWTRLNVLRFQERIMIVLGGRPLRTSSAQAYNENGREEVHCLLIEYFPKYATASANQSPFSVIEQKVLKGSWALSYEARLIFDEHLSLLYMDDRKRVVSCTIPIAPGHAASSKEMPTPEDSLGLLDRHLLKNPFKALKLRSYEHLPLSKSDASSTIEPVQHVVPVETEIWALPMDEHVIAVALRYTSAEVRGAVGVYDNLLVFVHSDNKTSTTKVHTSGFLLRLRWVDDGAIALNYSDRIDVWNFTAVNSDIKLEKRQTFLSHPSQVSNFQTSNEMLRTYLDSSGGRVIVLEPVNGTSQVQKLWKTNNKIGTFGHATCVLPLSTGLVVGYDDGYLRRFSIFHLGNDSSTMNSLQSANHALGGPILHLEAIDKSPRRRALIVGGADDGSVALWDQQTLELVARWVLFVVPLTRIIHIKETPSSRLKDSIICISQDGTIAFIALEGPHFLFLVPGSEAPLKQIHIDTESLWLSYKDELARQWDLQSCEFRRSTSRDRTPELLNPGPWMHWDIDSMIAPKAALQRLDTVTEALDAVSVLSFNLVDLFQPNSAPQDATNRISEFCPPMLTSLRTILSALLTFGLNEEIDRICEGKLNIRRTAICAGLQRDQSVTLFKVHDAKNSWSTSSRATTIRLVGIITALRTWMNMGHASDSANTILLFYTTSLAHSVGQTFKPPSVALLAKHWLESTSKPVLRADNIRSVDLMSTSEGDIRQAIRQALDSELARIEDAELVSMADEWQDRLPSLQTDVGTNASQAAAAVFICGQIAVVKFNLLSTTTLVALSKSIAMYLHDDDDLHRTLAIDLCARGFDVWQNHADAMDLLRALFQMAALPSKKDISTHNIGTQARQAVVHIANHNTPLFTTTLLLEILQPQSLQDRRSVMQILAFLVRKKPMVVYTSLPRLIEAVVKSLDPTSTSERDAVFDAATEILGHVVQRFPIVDFHAATQRLAVGTGEGAVVMYDLKTATRLFVLDGHKKRNTGCSFSPDGRRLVTVSLDESMALVWKVGSSFSSFFNPGAPPRQGHSGSEPFKTYPFNIGHEAQMTLAETLDLVKFEWPTEKNVRIKIRNSTLTFSTQ